MKKKLIVYITLVSTIVLLFSCNKRELILSFRKDNAFNNDEIRIINKYINKNRCNIYDVIELLVEETKYPKEYKESLKKMALNNNTENIDNYKALLYSGSRKNFWIFDFIPIHLLILFNFNGEFIKTYLDS